MTPIKAEVRDEIVVPVKAFRYEPSSRWVRVQFGGEFVADTHDALLVWDFHHIPTYFFPRDDVREEFLESTGRGRNERTTYHVQTNGRTAENAAYSYTEPEGEREVLKDYVAFRWNKMDAWYEEAEQVYVHARDPYTRVDVVESTRHVQVMVDGVMVADTKRPYLLFETNLPTRYYIPQEDVEMELLIRSETHTQCPYKGEAAYYSIQTGAQVRPDLVWYYPDPIPEQPKIKGLLAFYNEKVDLLVDGELQERPQTPWS